MGPAFRGRALEAHPWLAVLAAWEEIAAGDVAATVRLADVAERGAFEGRPPDGTASFEAGRAMLRAAMVRRGATTRWPTPLERSNSKATIGSWRDFALWQLAFARLTLGDRDGADAALADAVVAARSSSDLARLYCLLGHRALVAAEQGAWDVAAALIAESDAIAPLPWSTGTSRASRLASSASGWRSSGGTSRGRVASSLARRPCDRC